MTFFLVSLSLFSQTKYTLSGYIRDAASGEDLVGATVVIPSTGAGGYANEYGFYSLTIPEGKYQVEFRYLSYETLVKEVDLKENTTLSVELGTADVKIEEVEIRAEKEDANVTSTEMSTVTLDIERVKKLPALFGEVDIIKTIQLLPGIQSVGEGLSGYYVRGGNNDHNLILLDEATVFNASHVLGFFSVFNADALKSETKLYKGGIPAQYGGRLASVLDLRMKEGNSKEFHGSGGIGLISSRLSLEGPIVKDKGSFMLSGRRTYADVFLLFAKDPDLRKTQAYFYDFNAKANWKFSDKDRLFASGYFGRDVFKFRDLFGNDWGNATGTLRWNHLFSDKLFCNTTFVYSDFFYGLKINFDENQAFTYQSAIRDMSLKTDFSWYANPKNKIRFGAQATLHRFNPGQFIPESDTGNFVTLAMPIGHAVEYAGYIGNEQKFSPRFTAEYGLRYSFFDRVGPGTVYDYDASGETIVDSTVYSDWAVMKHYGGIEPRIGARFIVDEKSSIKASYNRMRQYLHLASNSTASFPWDLWIPSSTYIPPQIADQVAVGYFRNFADNEIEASVELYYKWMRNQIDFKNGAQLLFNRNIETELLYGKGWAYGAEFLVKKNYGKLTGWIGYTLSWVNRQIPGINNGQVYHAKNDRRHDVSIVASYEVKPSLTFSATWIYYTGNAVTFPRHRTELEGFFVPVYSGRNYDRMPSFHRMDLACDLDFKKKKESQRWSHGLNISLYNVYGQKNPFSISFVPEDQIEDNVKNKPADFGQNPNRIYAVKQFLFRWVPSVTWNFKF